MNKAQAVKKQIETLYSYGANYADIARHLYNDRVDNNIVAEHKATGRDSAFDCSLEVFHYADGSILIIPCVGGISASA